MANNDYLNLARKYRSKNFDQIVGQDIVVRILKNSLYRNLLFPVYLLAGPRGCGKTSMARLFASAINCFKLDSFVKDPKVSLPCLECASCKAMSNLAHPDFIEIDAASNTGVDNVRAIIEAASYVPAIGKKKIYLIDEAHMLSKAAFNALLKIFEEPPTTAMFMLATTDIHKIIDTVKSRCFQLFFNPISEDAIYNNLKVICSQESINYEDDALLLISRESDGSLRDALNLLERLRLIGNSITIDMVLDTLGFIADSKLCHLLKLIIDKDLSALLEYCNQINLDKFNALITFKRFVELIHVVILIKNKIQNQNTLYFKNIIDLKIDNVSISTIVKMLEVCYVYENNFTKTMNKNLLLQMLFIKLCQENFNKANDFDNGNNQEVSHPSLLANAKYTQKKTESAKLTVDQDRFSVIIKKNEPEGIQTETKQIEENINIKKIEQKLEETKWDKFLLDIQKLNDPLVFSVFRQALYYKEYNDKIEVLFNKDLGFFQDLLDDTKSSWIKIIIKHFGDKIFNARFEYVSNIQNYVIDKEFLITGSSSSLSVIQNKTGLENKENLKTQSNDTINKKAISGVNNQKSSNIINNSNQKQATNNLQNKVNAIPININDQTNWPKANSLINIFPGKISQIKDN